MAAIIFDFDGTIADSFDYVADFIAQDAGKAPLSPEQRQALRGLSIAGMVRHMGYNRFTGSILFLKGRRRMINAMSHLDAFDGMPELVRKLHNEGHELFILSTNSTRNVRRFIHAQKIHKYFLQIYGGVGMFGKAPALRQLLRDQNIETDNAVYVGDEMRDIEAAQSIGLRGIAVTWGFASRSNLASTKPMAMADTPDELMSLLQEI
jgi:phosphoglycolate phosphatase